MRRNGVGSRKEIEERKGKGRKTKIEKNTMGCGKMVPTLALNKPIRYVNIVVFNIFCFHYLLMFSLACMGFMFYLGYLYFT
jgi:hypothetical protein